MATERQRLIHSLFEEYVEMYTSRDDRLTSRFSDNFSGYAGSSDQLVTDKEEWIRITRRDFSQVPGRIRFEMLDLALQDLAKDVVVATAFFHIHLPEPEFILSRETARLVLIFRHEESEWKIAHSGISIPYGLAHDAEIYPMSRLEERQLELERMIAERTQELAEANRQLEMLSNTDGLTNIGNRRIFDKTLIQEWNRALRAETPLALVMLDIDHFSMISTATWPAMAACNRWLMPWRNRAAAPASWLPVMAARSLSSCCRTSIRRVLMRSRNTFNNSSSRWLSPTPRRPPA